MNWNRKSVTPIFHAEAARGFLRTFKRPLVGGLMFAACSAVSATAAAATLNFSTAVDHASSVTNQMRSVAYGNSSVYLGYIQKTGANNREVDRQDDIVPSGAPLNSHTFAASDQPKALAVDDRGNVFIGTRDSGNTTSQVGWYTPTLGFTTSLSAGSPNVGGLDAVTLGGVHYLYAAYEGSGLIQRFNIETSGTITADTTFNAGNSTFTIPTAGVLRGMTVASDGTIYVASRGDNKLYEVSPDLSTVTSAVVPAAQDVALYGGNLYVTSYNGTNSLVRELAGGSLSFIQDFTAGAATLDGNPYARAAGGAEGWGGIDIDPSGRLWLADEQYGLAAGVTYDRLLVASVPEPSTLVLAALGLAALIAVRLRRSRGDA